jgi:chemotaxis protein MotB
VAVSIMANDNQPIIIKKIKKGGHGHHGGAWKVAFADFVTAMMAFFMLMWLMGSTTKEQKSAISNYFQNPSAIQGPGGASTSMIKNGGEMDMPTGEGPNPMEQNQPVPTDAENIDNADEGKASLDDIDEQDAEKIAKEKEKERMESLLADLKKADDASQALKPFKDQLLLDITSEGLRIQIVDKENRPMFAKGSANLENYTRAILHEIAKVINQVPNKISISGHTDKTPYASNNGYSNWELSADRANAARRALEVGGVPDSKIARVVGLSSSVLFDKVNPFNPINRRISIIVMNKATEDSVAHGEGKLANDTGAKSGPALPAAAPGGKTGTDSGSVPLPPAAGLPQLSGAPPATLDTAANLPKPTAPPAGQP